VFLAIDVGNTNIKLGVFPAGADDPSEIWRVSTQPGRTADEYGAGFVSLLASGGIAVPAIDAVAIASVVPPLDATLEAACKRFLKRTPSFFRADQQDLMLVLTDRPADAGADLVAAAIGARARYGAPAIVIAYGTATAFVAISSEGTYLGGAIAPGIGISIDALAERTAKLPRAPFEAPARAIGSNTIAALQSGLAYGFAGQTEAIVTRMRAELSASGANVKVIATGGLAAGIAALTPVIDVVDANLILAGIHIFGSRM
jgi:type III pantothenate kinase